jgi:hypothetical protein
VLTSGWRLLLVSPCGGRWWPGEPSTTRRSAVDRRTATMMYAYRNRSRAIRRWLPLNRGARDITTRSDGGHNTGEDRICCGGAPARRGGLDQTRRRSRAGRREDHGGQTSATISAQRNPASSRAMAAATTERTFLWAASCRNRRQRRTWAAHERATVSGGTPC